MAEYLDLVAVVKHVAIENFLAETDGFLGDSGMNNFYLYRLTGQHLHVVIPWDKSEATKDGPAYPILHNVDDVPQEKRNKLMERAMKWGDLQALYFDTLLACADSASEPGPGDGRGWLEREVEREYGQVRDAAIADTTKPYSNEDFAVAIDALRVFAQQRAEWVRVEVARRRPETP